MHVKLTKSLCIGTLSRFRFMEESELFRVRFTQVSLYIVNPNLSKVNMKTLQILPI